jgi:prepilin peptidase CpaA
MASPTSLSASLAWICLALLLAAAVWHDVRSHRIPNRLVVSGFLLGLMINGLLPQLTAMPVGQMGGLGWGSSLLGGAIGLAVLLPMYLMRALGAGDVKLMAMVGAFVGPEAVLGAAVATLVAGGVLALAAALHGRVAGLMLRNLRTMLTSSAVQLGAGEAPQIAGLAVSAGKLPYAVAIAAGTVAYLALGWIAGAWAYQV